MLISGTGRHRRPHRPSPRRVATAAAIAGASLMLPLVTASGAMAAPSGHVFAAHHQDHRHHPGGHHNHHRPDSRPATTSPAPSSTPSPSSSTTGTQSASPTPSATPTQSASPTPAQTTSPTPTASSTASSTPAAQPAAQSAATDAVNQVLSLINKARAAQGLPAYTITSGLTRSAESHNQVMASGCGLSHQCPGEAALGERESAAGVQWTSAGENIGDGGPVSTSAQDIAAMAVRLTQDMLDEQPPNDGHRKNLLSSDFTHIGIAVYRDAKGTVWLTQDFSG